VSWKKAKAFCDQLTNLDPAKGKYRLLTDAEWEYACRGGTTTQHYFGDSDKELGPFAWFAGNAKNKNENYPHEVGLMKPNSFGLNDMHGNVMEWCEDWYEDRLKGGINPVVAVGSKSRVRRGGSWESDSDKCLSAYRFPESSDKQASTIGFRVVREIIVGK
jgi:sulfatase modifying factor 1